MRAIYLFPFQVHFFFPFFSFCITDFFLFRFHLSCAADTLATIEEIAGGAMTSLVEDDDKNACSEAYPTLTRYFKGRRSCVMRFREEERKSQCRSSCGQHLSNLSNSLKRVAYVFNFRKRKVE